MAELSSRRTVYLQRLCLHFALFWPLRKAGRSVVLAQVSTFTVLNISANHRLSQVRNKEAVKPEGGQFCTIYVIYY